MKIESATQLFDEALPAALAKNPAAARAVGGTFAFRVTGDGGGEWVVNLDADPPSCGRGVAVARCSIAASAADVAKILRDPHAAMQLYIAGKVVVSGDVMLAMRLGKVFDLART